MRIIKIFSLLGLLAVGPTIASAQCDSLPPRGTIYHCFITSGGKVLIVDGATEPAESVAEATFAVTGYTSNPCGVLLSTLEFESKSFTVSLGELTTTLQPGTPSTATITQTDPGSPSLFPAELEISLNLYGTATALPGKQFKTVSPLILRSTGEINELPLSSVQVKQLPGSTAFVDNGVGTGVVFGLQDVNVTLNENGQ